MEVTGVYPDHLGSPGGPLKTQSTKHTLFSNLWSVSPMLLHSRLFSNNFFYELF